MLTLSGEETLLFFFGGLSGVGGDVDGLLMIDTRSMMAVFCVRSCVIVDLVVSGRICVDGGDVSFSWLGAGSVSGRRRWTSSSCGLARPLASRGV